MCVCAVVCVCSAVFVQCLLCSVCGMRNVLAAGHPGETRFSRRGAAGHPGETRFSRRGVGGGYRSQCKNPPELQRSTPYRFYEED